LRARAGDTADVYYYRTLAFCKQFSRMGSVWGQWEDLAAFIRFPGAARELEALFVDANVVSFDGRVWGWYEWNGRIIEAMDADAKYRALKRKAERSAEVAKIKKRENRKRGKKQP
jgi:hypothetical protein